MYSKIPAVLIALTLLLSGSVSSSDTVECCAGVSTTLCLSEEENLFVDKINAHRQKHGLGALQVSFSLTRSAKFLAVDMACKNYFSHQEPSGRKFDERLKKGFGYYAKAGVAENIAAGHISAEKTLEQFITSESHNKNMLNPNMKAIGVGRARGGRYQYYWVTDFGTNIDTKDIIHKTETSTSLDTKE